MDKELTFHIVIIKPPPNVDYGLQKGSGRNYETVQKQKSKSREDLSFKCVVKIKGERSKDQLPKLSGPFVQGRALDRFIYIGIGTFAGESDSKWSRRLKIPMTGISCVQRLKHISLFGVPSVAHYVVCKISMTLSQVKNRKIQLANDLRMQ